MAVEIPFRRDFAFEYGRLESVVPGIRRIVANNPGPFTFRGTGTYVIGEGEVAVIDPGPDLEEHVDALLKGLEGEHVTHILVTHTHRDHSPAAAAVKAATGAPTYGFGPHAGGKRGEAAVEEGGDWDFMPDITVKDGDEIVGPGWRTQLDRRGRCRHAGSGQAGTQGKSRLVHSCTWRPCLQAGRRSLQLKSLYAARCAGCNTQGCQGSDAGFVAVQQSAIVVSRGVRLCRHIPMC